MIKRILNLKWGIAMIALVLIASCQTENDDEFTIEQVNAEIIQKTEIESTSNQTRRPECGSLSGSNNLVTCDFTNYINPVSTVTSWNIGNNGPGYIDYELERNFLTSCEFSYLCTRPCGPAVEETFGEVHFIESPFFNIETFQFEYQYLSNEGITLEEADVLKDHFACKINAYQLENNPGWIISEVNFTGDSLLCNTFGISSRYIRATFKHTRHQCL